MQNHRNEYIYSANSCQQTISELVERKIDMWPDKIAVSYKDDLLTYSALEERANQLAHALIERGAGSNQLIGVCMQRSSELVVALLAILKSGAAYLPVEPSLPVERIRFILNDAKTLCLLADDQSADMLDGHEMPIINLDTMSEHIKSFPMTRLIDRSSAEDLAYVIYTSGSTGDPKGVKICHRNVVRLFLSTYEWFHFQPSDIFSIFHSYAFDFSVWELWGALVHGARAVIVPRDISHSAEEFHTFLCDKKITILNQTPSAFRQLQHIDASHNHLPNWSLRMIIFGGEALNTHDLTPWFERYGDERPQLINMYGITETTVHVTYQPLTKQSCHQSTSPIGIPIPDLRIYLLDEHLQLVPTGVPGEIHVGGEGLAHGYLNHPQLTAERFIKDPFSQSGERLYKSGDLAQYLDDGSLEFIGRKDLQIKIDGYRIEPGEIESALKGMHSIKDAAVVACDDQQGRKRLIAYIVPSGNYVIDSTTELRAQLLQILPYYMVPANFISLTTMPLTENGKLDIQALPKNENKRPYLATCYVVPTGDVQSKIACIWSQVIGVEPIGIDDNFFELGGRSLNIVTLQQCLERNFNVKIPTMLLFEMSTIRGFATWLKEKKSEANTTEVKAKQLSLKEKSYGRYRAKRVRL